MAFFKSEVELAVSSSTASYDFDTCPYANLPQASSSDSEVDDDACLPCRFNSFHLSSHNVSPCSSGILLHTSSSVSVVQNHYDHCGSPVHPGSSDSVVHSEHFHYNVNSSHRSASCSGTSHSSSNDARSCSSPGHARHLSAFYRPQKSLAKVEYPGIASAGRRLCLCLQRGELSRPHESCSDQSAGPKDTDSACQRKIPRSSPELYADSVQAKSADNAAASGKPLLLFSRCFGNNNESIDSSHTHKGCADNPFANSSSKRKAIGGKEMGDGGKAPGNNAAALALYGRAVLVKPDENKNEVPMMSRRDVWNPTPVGHSQWIDSLNPQLTPRAIHLDMNTSCNHEPHRRPDWTKLDLGCPQVPNLYSDSFHATAMCSLLSVMSGEFSELYHDAGDVFLDGTSCLSLNTLSCISSETKVDSEDWRNEGPKKKDLKRKVSYDSLEVANSFNNFSKSTQSECSLPKYALTVDKSCSDYAHQSPQGFHAESKSEVECTNSQPTNHSKILVQMPLDFELEFCKKKGWIL